MPDVSALRVPYRCGKLPAPFFVAPLRSILDISAWKHVV
ncbi:hypothetical protein CFter6_2689 [Collimonas fungivorans]|uniref:Uncharacterized protein n=1 Tax=Collimonas fungivorans TaxID=158899 RepID=A0A127PC96_9BURK|nr:hypothetical protein CFter6_2689 [Collimonas fungivorans]